MPLPSVIPPSHRNPGPRPVAAPKPSPKSQDIQPWNSQGSQEGVHIFVKTLNGKTIAVVISPMDSVDKLKEIVEGRTGINRNELRLLYSGKQLESGRSLMDYNIMKESTLHLGMYSHHILISFVSQSSTILRNLSFIIHKPEHDLM